MREFYAFILTKAALYFPLLVPMWHVHFIRLDQRCNTRLDLGYTWFGSRPGQELSVQDSPHPFRIILR